MSNASQPDFTVFTHQKKLKKGEPLIRSYKDLREAVLELFLQVKIRDDAEIEVYNEEMYNKEKRDLDKKNGYEIVEMIKQCIEQLMQLNDDSQ